MGTGRKAEVDVHLDLEDNKGFLVIECKAKNPGARGSEVDVCKWLNDRGPLLLRFLYTCYIEVERPFHF